MKNHIVTKLTSRKFWIAVIGFVTALMIAHGAAPDSVEQVSSTIMAFGTLIAYLFAEGIADRGDKDD